MHWKHWLTHVFSKRSHCTQCGAPCCRFEIFRVLGTRETAGVRQPANETYCSTCLTKTCIHCAWCGNAIWPSDAITLFTPKKGVRMPPYAVKYRDDPLQYVGCVRGDCADSGIDRAGFWFPPGHVYRVMSPMEQLLAQMKQGDDSCVIVGDINNPAEALPAQEM